MNENLTFSQAITEYISMALHIWPALQLSLPNLHQAVAPPSESAIRTQNFTSMSSEQFIQAMITDLHNFIMEHDVKVDHIVTFLDDILAILNTEQENDTTMTHMAQELVQLIAEVPEGNYTRLVNFRFVYNSLKGQNLGHVVQQQQQFLASCSEGQSEDQNEQIQQQYQNHIQQPENNENKIQEQVPQLTSEQKQDLQDDGWVVVTKKKKGKK